MDDLVICFVFFLGEFSNELSSAAPGNTASDDNDTLEEDGADERLRSVFRALRKSSSSLVDLLSFNNSSSSLEAAAAAAAAADTASPVVVVGGGMVTAVQRRNDNSDDWFVGLFPTIVFLLWFLLLRRQVPAACYSCVCVYLFF